VPLDCGPRVFLPRGCNLHYARVDPPFATAQPGQGPSGISLRLCIIDSP